MRDHNDRPVTGPATRGEIERAERRRHVPHIDRQAWRRRTADPDPEPPLTLGVSPGTLGTTLRIALLALAVLGMLIAIAIGSGQ